MNSILRGVLFLVLIVSAYCDLYSSINCGMPVMLVSGEKGAFCHLPFSFNRDQSGRALRVFIADDTPNGTREGLRGSVWLAAMTAAMLKNDPLDGVRLTVEFSGDTDGPSAGGIICLSILQAMERKTIPADFSMTGTIMPDGTIGIVGGVALKIEAAIASGIKRICIPAFIRFERQNDGTYVDLFRMGVKKGVSIYPVKTINEVYRIVNGISVVKEEHLSEADILAIPSEIDDRVVKKFTGYFGNAGPRYTTEDEKYWRTVGKETGYNLWHADLSQESICWSLIRRGKILAANDGMLRFRSLYGDFRNAERPVFSTYWDAMTNEFALTKEISIGTNKWLSVATPPYTDKHRTRMIKWNEWGRGIVRECDDAFQQTVKVVADKAEASGVLYFPDGNTSEIASQGEDEMSMLTEAMGYIRYYNALLSRRKKPSEMNDQELYDGIKEIMGINFRIVRFINYISSSIFTTNRCMVYSGMYQPKQNKKVQQAEKAFYSAVLSVSHVLEREREEEAEEENMAKSMFIHRVIDGVDPEYAILRAAVAHMRQNHRVVEENKVTNSNYNVSAQLYRQSQILAKACAVQVKFSPDVEYDFNSDEIGNSEFVQFLVRMARQSALSSIEDCKKAGIPCIDPILKVQLGDVAMGDGEVFKALEMYWCAHLGCKALLMGGSCKTYFNPTFHIRPSF